MKKLCLAAITTLLLPNMSYAAACADGENADGCTISTSDITYTLTGNITPASGVDGIEFTSGADGNDVTQTGNITTTGKSAYGLYLETSESNTTNLTGNITTTGKSAYGLYIKDSDSNTTTITGDIITSGTNKSEPILLENSDSNTFTPSSTNLKVRIN